MPVKSISLTEHFDKFIASGVRAGRYTNESEVIGAALRLLEQREHEEKAKIAWLRGAIQEGLDAVDNGDYVALDSAEELAAHLRALGEEASAEVASAR